VIDSVQVKKNNAEFALITEAAEYDEAQQAKKVQE